MSFGWYRAQVIGALLPVLMIWLVARMEQPPGYVRDKNLVCKLEKSLYGLKQASKQWNACFSSFLETFNLVALRSNSCVFVSTDGNLTTQEDVLIVCIYVDDGLVISNSVMQ